MRARPGTIWPAWLAVLVLAAGLASMTGCSGPPYAPRPPQFGSMPPPGQWGEPDYATILGPVSGIGSRTFAISARPGLAAWLGCAGKGLVWIKGAMAFAAVCGESEGFVGGLTQPAHLRRGQKVTVVITGPATARWELRIDAPPWPVTPQQRTSR